MQLTIKTFIYLIIILGLTISVTANFYIRSDTEQLFNVDDNGARIDQLAGTYSNGEGFLCVYDNGTVFIKDSLCV